MKKRSSNNGAKGVVLGIAFLVAAVGAGAYITTRMPKPQAAVSEQQSSVSRDPNVVHVRTFPKAKIYVVKMQGDEPSLVPVEVKLQPGTDKHEAALQKLLESNQAGKDTNYGIPQGTKLLSFAVTGQTAEVDFSKEFVDNFNGGAELEALTVKSIVHTVSQFGDVKAVRFLVEGKKLESLGHLDLSEPVQASPALLESGE